MTKVENRIEIEKKIASKVITLALEKGYTITVNDGEAYPLVKSSSNQDILNSMFSVDEESLLFYNKEGKFCGSVFFVYGNDGWDVICDYSTRLEEDFMNEVMKYCEQFE